MAFLAGLGSLGTGIGQGIQSGQAIQQRAVQIQQAQLALDDAKKQTMADAAAFANLSGGGAGGPGGTSGGQPLSLPGGSSMPPQPQPPAPGQPSVPNQPQGGQMQPQQQMPAGGAPMAPQPGSQGVPQQGGQPGPQDDPTSPQAAIKTVYGIAQEIKARNPDIDPKTLMLATQKVIDMSKGIDPGLRAQASVIAAQIAANSRQGVAETNADSRSDVAGINAGAKTDAANIGADSRVKVAGIQGGARVQSAQIAADAAMNRTKEVQQQINSRFTAGQGNQIQKTAMNDRLKSITSQLTAATRQLALLKDATGQPLPDTDPRVQKVQKDIADANAKLDILAKAAGGATQGGPDAGGGALPADLPPPAGHAEGSTAKDAQGNVVAKIQGGKWVAP